MMVLGSGNQFNGTAYEIRNVFFVKSVFGSYFLSKFSLSKIT